MVAEALLSALGHIHAAGIVHRDVKPGNVLVEGWDRILLTDFGIAQSTEQTRLTKVDHVVGTRDFLAPELMRGERATPVSDLYSCGVVLRELLRDGEPPGLAGLVERLTAEDPGARPASADEALDLLSADPGPATAPMTAPLAAPARSPESVLADSPPASPPTDERPLERGDEPDPPPSSGGRPSRLALVIAAAAAVLVAAAAIALGLGAGDGGEESTTGSRQAAKERPERSRDETVTEATTVTETAEAPAPAPEEAAAEEASSGDGVALNNEGFALLQSGDVEAALPKLEQAVAAFPEDSTDINYAYALFNYAQALRLSGDPGAAIPLLEKRLAISDFKVAEVKAELDLAREQAD